MVELINGITQSFLLLLLAPLVSGVVKVTKARLQNRRGPGVFQVYFDLFKLLRKDSVISPTVSWIFFAAPMIYLGTVLAAAALIPVLVSAAGEKYGIGDLFVLLYLLAAGRFFLALASLDAGSSFGGMGGSREMFIAMLVEPVIILTLLTVALRASGSGLALMAATAAGTPFSLPYVFAAIAFLMVLLAETGRIPVDNPDTHLELTMIHEGMVLEYSGRHLGLIFWASSVKQTVMILLFVLFFLPWPVTAAPMNLVAIGVKTLGVAVLLGCVETSTNKMRLFRVPGFMAVGGLLSLLALVAQ
ncbi:MAG TPA: NADH-quinone oxidoreductase subunit H [Patescibacteria group bacterium]|nr:NADH-quinone oxidoreductase subunit H [Patescibacteria group bacterium]